MRSVATAAFRRALLRRFSTAAASSPSSSSASAGRSVAHVKQVTEDVHESILAPLNTRLQGPLERRPFTEGIPLPSVLLLGNHSSGKSSFINYVLGRDVQATGVAPTDDGFTVIAPGAEDADRDGPTFIGDPGFGFAPLRVFGPSFMSHFHLKVRSNLKTQLLLIDSPGMIDSPASYSPATNSWGAPGSGPSPPPPLSSAVDWSTTERGYDFLRVTQWLAEHADVILLFFDPDKPGTTGETLQCLTTSLRHQEHKLHIVMNKVDQFVHLHDFARAYGSLCWNLSKLTSDAGLDELFVRLHATEVSEGDEYARSLWRRVRPQLQSALANLSLTELHGLSPSERTALDDILQRQVPDLRRLTSSHQGVQGEK